MVLSNLPRFLRSPVAAARMIAGTRTTLASKGHMIAASTTTMQLLRSLRKHPLNKLINSCRAGAGGLLLFLLLFATGVEVAVQADKAFFLHVGVYLRGSQVGVPQHILDDAEVGAVFQ